MAEAHRAEHAERAPVLVEPGGEPERVLERDPGERRAQPRIAHQVRAARDAPDLILVELGRVPPGEALAAGRRIRRGAGLPGEVPVVAYANNAGEVAREGEAVEFRPGEHVVLPDDTEQLIGWLRRLAA